MLNCSVAMARAHELSLIIAGVQCACLLLIVVFTNFNRKLEQPKFEGG